MEPDTYVHTCFRVNVSCYFNFGTGKSKIFRGHLTLISLLEKEFLIALHEHRETLCYRRWNKLGRQWEEK